MISVLLIAARSAITRWRRSFPSTASGTPRTAKMSAHPASTAQEWDRVDQQVEQVGREVVGLIGQRVAHSAAVQGPSILTERSPEGATDCRDPLYAYEGAGLGCMEPDQ